MKLIRDETGRLPLRPFYLPGELDHECERIITAFMAPKYGDLQLPIPTDELTKLIERDAGDLDLYADLSAEGLDVHGVTDFIPGQKPRVRIAQELSEVAWGEHRLRTTLSHEYGHVAFHARYWDQFAMMVDMFPELRRTEPSVCKRETIVHARRSDWMEWQAGYVCGALLMPISHLKRIVTQFIDICGLHTPLEVRANQAGALVAQVASAFDVSEDAASVRLLQLGLLSHKPVARPLF